MRLWTRRLPYGVLAQLRQPELRRRLAVTLGLLALARCLEWLPLPGLDPRMYAQLFNGPAGAAADTGAIARLSIGALGLGPYVGMWVLMEIFKGDLSAAKVERARVIGATLLTAFQAYGIAVGLEAVTGLVVSPGLIFVLTTVTTLLAGSLLLIWLGTLVLRFGVGPGIWVLYAGSIAAELPSSVHLLFQALQNGALTQPLLAGIATIAVGLLALIVLFEGAQRDVGLMQGGAVRLSGATLDSEARPRFALPLDHVTIVPAYLASSLIALPAVVVQIIGSASGWSWLIHLATDFRAGTMLHLAAYATLMFFSVFVLTAIRVRPGAWAAQWAREQKFAPGILPGAPTARYLDGIVTRLTLFCACYLTFLHIVPEWLIARHGVPLYIGGSSYLVVVLVALHILRGVSDPVPPPNDSVAVAARFPRAADMR